MKTKYHTLPLTAKERDLITDAVRVVDGQLLQLYVGANERSRGEWLEIESFLDAYLQKITRAEKKRACLDLANKIRSEIDNGEPSRIEEPKPVVLPEVKTERHGALF